MAQAFNHHNASLSEGRALAAVVGALPGKPYGTRVGTDSPRRLRPPWRGGARCVPALHGAPRLEGKEVERATPWFLALVRHRAGRGGAHENPHHLPSPSGVAPSTVIPGGKAIEPIRKLESMTLPVIAATAGMFINGGAGSGWTSGRRHRFAEQVIGRDLCRAEYDVR